MGDEPDADQCLDAQLRAARCGCRRAMCRRGRGRGFEVGGVAAVRGAVGGADGGSGWPPTCRGLICWRCRSMASTSRRVDPAWLRSASMVEARSIRSAWSKGRPRTPRSCRRCSTTWSSAGSTQRWSWLFIIDGSKALSKAIRRTFGHDTPIQRCQSTRRATSSNGCRNRCMPRCARPAAGLGTRRCRQGREAAAQPRPPAGAGWPGRRRPHPGGARRDPTWSASACRRNCGARWPAPTSSRT